MSNSIGPVCRNCHEVEVPTDSDGTCPACKWWDSQFKKRVEAWRANPDAYALLNKSAMLTLGRNQWANFNLAKWEYKAVQQQFKNIDMNAINALGRTGWELVSVMPSTKTSGFLAVMGIEGFTNTDSIVFFFRRPWISDESAAQAVGLQTLHE